MQYEECKIIKETDISLKDNSKYGKLKESLCKTKICFPFFLDFEIIQIYVRLYIIKKS
jgi:hypothetical protein